MRLLYLIQIEDAVISTYHLNNLIGEEMTLVIRTLGNDNVGLSTFIEHYQHTPVDHHIIHCPLEEVAYLDRMLWMRPTWDMYEESVHRKHRVERHYRVGSISHLTIKGTQPLIGLGERAAERHIVQLKRSQADTIVGSKVRLDIRISVSLHLA